jgi:hypothetical protein
LATSGSVVDRPNGNRTLEDFLEALATFAEARVVDKDGQDDASWQLFAEMVVAATGYE